MPSNPLGMLYNTRLSNCRFLTFLSWNSNDYEWLDFQLSATVKIVFELYVLPNLQNHPETVNLFPYNQRLLEPWISSELSFHNSELILYLLAYILFCSEDGLSQDLLEERQVPTVSCLQRTVVWLTIFDHDPFLYAEKLYCLVVEKESRDAAVSIQEGMYGNETVVEFCQRAKFGRDVGL
jgi:hypothetical protein